MRHNSGHFVLSFIKKAVIEQYKFASSLKNIECSNDSKINMKIELVERMRKY